MPASAVRVVGTNTLRTAHNAADFLVRAEEALGHSIETISGIEEARLIYLGAAHSLAESDTRRLVVDIGGGSTELIVGTAFRFIKLASRPPTTEDNVGFSPNSLATLTANLTVGEVGFILKAE